MDLDRYQIFLLSVMALSYATFQGAWFIRYLNRHREQPKLDKVGEVGCLAFLFFSIAAMAYVFLMLE